MKKGRKIKEEKADKHLSAGTVIFIIINIFLGLFILYFGIYFLIYKAYIEGSIAILLGIFSFLPKRVIKISQGKKFLIVIIALVVLMVLSVLFSKPAPENFIYHNTQEKFIVDLGMSNVSLIIHNATESTSILIGNQEKKTNGYFVFIDCGLTNLATGSMMIKSNLYYSLNDNQNETFRGTFSGIQQVLQPNLEKKCYFLFEVPKTSQGFKLHIKDFTGTHVVDLKI